MSQTSTTTQAKMYVFSFSYWMIIANNLPIVKTILIDGISYNIYKPYRVSPANESFLPHPNKAIQPNGQIVNFPLTVPKLEMYPVLNTGNPLGSLQGIVTPEFPPEYLRENQTPVDSLRIDVNGSTENVTFLIRDLLDIVRVKSRQWWMGRITTVGYVACELEFETEDFQVFGKWFMVNNWGEKLIDESIWVSAIEDVSNNIIPLPFKYSFLDAIFHFSIGDLRRAALDLANSLDNAVNVSYEKIWIRLGLGTANDFSRRAFVAGSPLPPRWTTPSDTRISFLLNEPLDFRISRSFKREYPGDFAKVETFWKDVRNPVSHGQKISVATSVFEEYIRSIEICLNWLESL